MDKRTNQQMIERTYERLNERLEQMDKNEQMIERTYEQLNERLNKWIKMNARTNELTNVWTTPEHIFAFIYILLAVA